MNKYDEYVNIIVVIKKEKKAKITKWKNIFNDLISVSSFIKAPLRLILEIHDLK